MAELHNFYYKLHLFTPMKVALISNKLIYSEDLHRVQFAARERKDRFDSCQNVLAHNLAQMLTFMLEAD